MSLFDHRLFVAKLEGDGSRAHEDGLRYFFAADIAVEIDYWLVGEVGSRVVCVGRVVRSYPNPGIPSKPRGRWSS